MYRLVCKHCGYLASSISELNIQCIKVDLIMRHEYKEISLNRDQVIELCDKAKKNKT